MGRYSLNVRPKYGPNELTGPEQFSQGIGTALGAYADYSEANRAEENQIGAQGGVRQPDVPGAGGRLGQLKNYIRKRVFGQTDPGAPAAPQPTPSGIVQAGAPTPGQGGTWDEHSPLSPSISNAIQASLTRTPAASSPAPPPVSPPVPQGLPAMPGGQQPGPFRPVPQGPAAPDAGPAAAPTPVLRTGPGQPPPPSAAMSPPASSIGRALQPYTYRSRSGASYTIDPNRAGDAARQQKLGEMTDEQTLKQGQQTKDEEEQIAALTAAGMDPKVARAKVLNKVVKYDETYGQQHPGVMNQKDRLAIQDRIDARQKRAGALAQQLEGLRQRGRQGTVEFQQLSIELRQQQQDDANDRAVMAGDEAAAGRAEGAVGRLQVNPIVSNTPEGKVQITEAQAAADAARAKAEGSRARVAGKAGRAPVARGAPANQKPVATRDAELKAQGMNAAARKAALLAEGYDVK